jgi:tRNA(Arg) A34 adenosine deaminase TadA
MEKSAAHKFISMAIEEARMSTHRQQMACVIFNKQGVVSKAHNIPLKSLKKLHPRFTRFDGSVHAEVGAIYKAKRDLSDCSLLIIRVNKLGYLRYARPCKQCMAYIAYAGIRKIYYSQSALVQDRQFLSVEKVYR